MKKYSEGPESTVTHEGQNYLVDDLLNMKGPIENIQISKLDWILDETTVDQDRVGKADLSFPIVVMKTKKYGYVVLDGVHRLSLAKLMGNKTIKAKMINESDLPSPI